MPTNDQNYQAATNTANSLLAGQMNAALGHQNVLDPRYHASHASCVTETAALTAQEQARVTDWLIRSLRERPEDFVQGDHTLRDSASGMQIWTAHGEQSLSLHHTGGSANLAQPYRAAIFAAIHQRRHHNGNPAFLALKAIMDAHPVAEGEPAVEIPADEFDAPSRTEPEVAKLRRMVMAIVASPVTTLVLGSVVMGSSIALISRAFAG
jgi:hypothetical protein